MKNKLEDLANHLFLQIERLSDDDMTEDRLRQEIARAGALERMAGRVIDVGHLALDAARLGHDTQQALPRLLGFDKGGA
jgi:hypothetical protein